MSSPYRTGRENKLSRFDSYFEHCNVLTTFLFSYYSSNNTMIIDNTIYSPNHTDNTVIVQHTESYLPDDNVIYTKTNTVSISNMLFVLCALCFVCFDRFVDSYDDYVFSIISWLTSISLDEI